jgi:hypothetical protein
VFVTFFVAPEGTYYKTAREESPGVFNAVRAEKHWWQSFMLDAIDETPETSGQGDGRPVGFLRAGEPYPNPPNNLPIRLTSFVGRQREIAELGGLLGGDARLLTLTGAGGSGKTRLALAVSSRVADRFGDGVGWVELARSRSPSWYPRK